jgi:hypothetical protein
MFRRVNSLKGRQLVIFSLPRTKWQITAEALLLIGMACSVIAEYFLHWPFYLWLLFWLPSMFIRPRHITIYEKGITVPKNAGTVFFTRDQLLNIKLVGDRLSVTGPDADWNGPYAGGTFQVPQAALPKVQEVLAQFVAPA